MVQQVDLKTTKPRAFWQHIVQRQPVVINGVDKAWERFTDEFIVEKAGDVSVMVEHRSSNKESYGQGKKVSMQICQLVEEIEKGNTGLYMSTQEVGVGRDGHPLLYGPPLVQLAGLFPLQQHLMGNLVPQSINMWMGCAPEGSSTGLHHDFHDNLYVLLRGCKRFRLYPPDSAPDMYVRGKIRRIYPNGRIVYEDQGDVLPDGSAKHDVQLWRRRHDADEAAAAAAADPSHADEADALLEQQLERMLDEGGDYDEIGGLADDYLDSDDAANSSDVDSEEVQPSQHETGSSHFKPDPLKALGKGSKRQLAEPAQSQQKKQKHSAAMKTSSSSTVAGMKAVEPPPPSFSQVDLSLPEHVLRKQFPRFPGLAACQEVLLQAGQMLYMPAGWFHEVTSYGGGGLDGGHLAINYWYHPPDNLDSSKAGFKQPYTSPYYPTIWAQRQPWLVQDTQRWWEQQQQHHKLNGPAAQSIDKAGTAVDALPQHLRVRTAGSGKHVGWSDKVHSPSNKYRMSMTKEGTATGDADTSPLGSQEGGGPCCGEVGCIEPDGPSESDSPCSKREPSHVTMVKGNRKQQVLQQQHRASRVEQATHHADECILRHVSAAAGTNPYDDPLQDAGSAAEGKTQNDATAAEVGEGDADEDERSLLSKEVSEGISAIEDYFSDNPEAMNALLAEFMQQRRKRVAAAHRFAAGGATVMALPRLVGRRHHHYAAVKIVPRKPARR